MRSRKVICLAIIEPALIINDSSTSRSLCYRTVDLLEQFGRENNGQSISMCVTKCTSVGTVPATAARNGPLPTFGVEHDESVYAA